MGQSLGGAQTTMTGDTLRSKLERLDAQLAARPLDAQLWLAKAREAWGLGDKGMARQAFERTMALGGASAEVYRDCAVMRLTLGDPLDDVRPLLAQALRLEPGSGGALYWMAYTFLLQEDYASAAGLLRQVAQLEPKNPHYRFLLGWTLGRSGDRAGSAQAFTDMANACLDEYRQSGDMSLLGHVAHALMASGLEAEGRGFIAQFAGRASGHEPSFEQAGYLPQTPTRLRLLRSLVAGRDLAIMAYGPSLAQFEENLEHFARADLCYFTFNEPIVEKNLLNRMDRRSELFCVTSPAVLNGQMPWLREYLARPERNMLLTHAGATEGLYQDGASRAWLESQHDARLLYFRSQARHPPAPSDPLHFPPYNTLSVALPLALLARPRRVFLFGCDGTTLRNEQGAVQDMFYSSGVQARRSSEAGANGSDAAQQRWRSSYDQWLAFDTQQFNFQIGVSLACLTQVFDLEPVPVYNCSNLSAYQGMARIDYPQCLRMLSLSGGQGARIS